MSYKLYDTEIEYLEGTGTQYINLGTALNSSTDVIDIEFCITQKLAGAYKLFGARSGASEKNYTIVTSNPNGICIDLQNATYSTYRVTYTYEVGVYYTIHMERTLRRASSNGVTIAEKTNASQSFTTERDAYLFSFNQSGNNWLLAPCRIKSLKWRRNDLNFIDLIPVRVGNVGYMYDKVSGKLFGNAGTGNFILGPDVAPGRYANEIAFLESTGSQYIDTGITCSNNSKVELKVMANGTQTYTSGLFGSRNYTTDVTNAFHLYSFVTGIQFGFNNLSMNITGLTTQVSHVYTLDKNIYYIDGVQEGSFTDATFTCPTSALLFTTHTGSDGTEVDSRIFKGKLYYCKIWNGDTLVRDFIPVEYNNIGYLYDKVSGKFFANQGTGKFVLGHRAPRFDGKACARSYTRRQLMMKAPVPLERQYLTFKALESGTFTFARNAVSYSLDEGITWNTLSAGTASPNVPAGKTIMWKGTITPGSTTGVGTFSATGSFNVLGNAMSLLFGDNFAGVKTLSGKKGAFYNLFLNNNKLVSAENLSLPALTMVQNGYISMFQGCSHLVYPPELPATTLADNCYQYMFGNCTRLITAPVLPAIALKYVCYGYMFQGCTSLVNAPELPATALAFSCYGNMFNGCTSLVNAPELPATSLAGNCYDGMFKNCTSLTTAPELPATTLAGNCYKGMFESCTNLTTAPELPAITLVNWCYGSMFYACRKLRYIKAMFTTTPSAGYTSNWVRGVSATGTFVKNSAATWDVTGVNGIPSGWTVETADE